MGRSPGHGIVARAACGAGVPFRSPYWSVEHPKTEDLAGHAIPALNALCALVPRGVCQRSLQLFFFGGLPLGVTSEKRF